MYYNQRNNEMLTSNQLFRRGLLHPSVTLADAEIYPLEVKEYSFDEAFQCVEHQRVEGNRQEGFTLVGDVVYRPAAQVESELLDRVAERRWKEEIRGISWNGHLIDTGRDSQSKLVAEVQAVDRGLRADGKKWKMQDGSFIALSNAQIEQLATSVHTHVTQMFEREEQLAELIKSKETAVEKIAVFRERIGKNW